MHSAVANAMHLLIMIDLQAIGQHKTGKAGLTHMHTLQYVIHALSNVFTQIWYIFSFLLQITF